MKLLSNRIILCSIILIAIFLRFWDIGKTPPSPDWDEAALGYNAYSILKTGRDEYGTWFPAVLRSYDDYKPPLYAYLAIAPIAVFGLDTWVVRLPSAVMGVLAVLGTYFLTQELNKHTRRDVSFGIPATASLLLAISPWHIQFSRIAFEANIGVTLNVWGLVLFFKGLKSMRWLMGSAFLFALGLYAYHSERIFLPLFLIALSWIYRRDLFKDKKAVLLAAVVGLITIAPLLRIFFDPATLTRLRGTSSLADQTGLLSRSVQKLEEDRLHGNPWGFIFDNRRIVWTKTILDGYLSHFSLRWLYLTGDNARHHAPDMGLLYFVELPFFLLGIFTVANKGGKASYMLFSWILLAPVAASPTTELPHAIRTLVFLPTFQIFTATGLLNFFQFTAKSKGRSAVFAFVCILFAANIIYYIHMYFVHMNREFSKYWQYGYKQAVSYVLEHKDAVKKVVVSTKLEQPHMFFLYFLRYDPMAYLKEGGTSSGGFKEERNKFDMFEFRPIDWGNEAKDGTTLYIGNPAEITGNVVQTIYYLDGTEAMRIAK